MSYATGAELCRKKGIITVAVALRKVYLVKSNNTGSGGYINMPKCMLGKRIKIIEAE